MATGVASWSTTAATNATADSSVNWAEGQAPSSVNDSARAMMASVAKWRDDNARSIVSAGTSTAYTATTNQVFATKTAMDGKRISVYFHATNGAAPTLNVDTLGAAAISSSVGTAIGTAQLKADSVYDLIFRNSSSEWILLAGSAMDGVFAAGTAIVFTNSAAPVGWTKTVTHNDKALRIVSGTGGATGGSTAFTTVFASRTITQGHLPSVSLSAGSLTASTPALTANGQTAKGWDGTTTVTAPNTGGTAVPTSGSMANISVGSITVGGSVPLGGSGTGFDFAVQYVDAILCSKS